MPEAAQKDLFPFTVPILFGTGLVNTLYEQGGGAVVACVAVATVGLARGRRSA